MKEKKEVHAKEKSKQTMMDNMKHDKAAMEKVMEKVNQPKCEMPKDM